MVRNDEEKVYNFLKSKGYKNIKYEPDGNVPPDFLINEKIAVEVTRLNFENIEWTYEFIKEVRDIVENFKRENFTNYVLFTVRFNALINERKIKRYIKYIREILCNYDGNTEKDEVLDNYVEISLKPILDGNKSSKILDPYLFSSSITIGFLVSEAYKKLKKVIIEKGEKKTKINTKYDFWWLILVDHTGICLSSNSERDLKKLKELVMNDKSICSEWDEISILMVYNGEYKIFDLYLKG